jgi:hypothetical protein
VNNLSVDLVNWGLNIAFWSSFTFLTLISIVWPWWKSAWGVNIILLEFAISLALLPSIASHDFGFHTATSSGALWLDVAALWLVGIIVIWRGGMIIIEQVRGVRKANHRNTEPVEVIQDNNDHVQS